jgi:hypothetical protein
MLLLNVNVLAAIVDRRRSMVGAQNLVSNYFDG